MRVPEGLTAPTSLDYESEGREYKQAVRSYYHNAYHNPARVGGGSRGSSGSKKYKMPRKWGS
jgi:hypothetical protein